jgi:hypothetical protein
MTIPYGSDKPVDEEGDCGSYGYRKLYNTLLDRSVDFNKGYEHLRP